VQAAGTGSPSGPLVGGPAGSTAADRSGRRLPRRYARLIRRSSVARIGLRLMRSRPSPDRQSGSRAAGDRIVTHRPLAGTNARRSMRDRRGTGTWFRILPGDARIPDRHSGTPACAGRHASQGTGGCLRVPRPHEGNVRRDEAAGHADVTRGSRRTRPIRSRCRGRRNAGPGGRATAGRRVGGTTGRRDDGSAGPACSTGREQASESRFAGAYAALHGRSSASRGPATPSRRLVCSPGPRRLRGAEPAMEELIIDRGRRVVRPVSRPRTFDPPACRPTGERTRETSIQDPGSIGRGRFMSGTRGCVQGGTGCPRP
jgi:hypothetical protein